MPTIVMQHSNPTTSHSAAVCSLCAFVLEYVYMLWEYQGQAGAKECCPITLPLQFPIWGPQSNVAVCCSVLQCVSICLSYKCSTLVRSSACRQLRAKPSTVLIATVAMNTGKLSCAFVLHAQTYPPLKTHNTFKTQLMQSRLSSITTIVTSSIGQGGAVGSG